MRLTCHISGARTPASGAATGRRIRTPIRQSPIANRHSLAFTLLEVVLAILIAIAILVVALAFHEQATTLRGALLEESERLAAVRQVMERLSADLRVAPVHKQFGFTGSSNSLRFVTTGLPLQPGSIESDLKRVTYQATIAGDSTNTALSGLLRSEAPELDLIAAKLAPALVTATGDTNAPATSAAEPLTDLIRFLSFRFWDGTAWRESWSGPAPPPGVEISLGFEPLPAEVAPEEYPGELFRRVIYLPAGQPLAPDVSLVASTKAP